MKKLSFLLVLCLLLWGCDRADFDRPLPTQPTQAPTTLPPETTVPPTTLPPETTVPETTVPETTVPLHSALYIPGLSVEDVILYFNEICLDAEFVTGGDATLLQKWGDPIYYTVYGDPTEADMAMLETFMAWLDQLEGFPGFVEAEAAFMTDLRIYFCSEAEMLDRLGDNFYGCDGGVTFWYDGNNVIYDATICYRTDLDQETRNSVILEEIYNGLGPVQDTWLRDDSIVYAGYSIPQALSEIDALILKLLYHPMMQCGMNAKECEAVIRQLYY